MKMAFRLILLGALAALGCWLWTVLCPSPEKLVLKKIAKLAATATFEANASNLVRAGKASQLVRLFTPDAQIIINLPEANRTLSGRDEIRETAIAGFASLTALRVQFLDVSVRLSVDKQSADVSCTAEVNAGDKKEFGVQEMHFQLSKLDDGWLISRAETIKTLQ